MSLSEETNNAYKEKALKRETVSTFQLEYIWKINSIEE